ncbi:MAG: hypothetical protein AB8B51_14090 [Sedimentitalea sp.]
MTYKTLFLLAIGLTITACGPKEGVGFTGIGASQAAQSAYALDFVGLGKVNDPAASSDADLR